MPRSLLLGWGNARPSQLAAYERLHRSLGLEPRSVIPHTALGLVRPDAYAHALAPLADDLARVSDDKPIVVHLFSDNGFIGWAALLAALGATEEGRRAKARIRGVVLDSSPGLWNVTGPVDFARRFALGMTPALARAVGLGARERLPIVTPLLGGAFLVHQLLLPGIARSMRTAADRVAREQPRCPHLFLYGEEDVLVPPGDVRAWIARQERDGLPVEAHAFAGARHVALYPEDPRGYRDRLAAFLARVLRPEGP